MSDLISRQAVLSYINRIQNQGTGKKKSFEFIQKFVEKLPSAEKTGHCTTLEEWKNDFKGFINELSMPKDDYKGIMEYIDEVPNESKWIPVSEPPKELGTYLIQTDGEPYMCRCRWTDVNPFWTDYKTKPHWNIFDLPQYSKVVAWMPLPKPYLPDTNIGNMSEIPTGSKDVIWHDKRNYSEIVVELQEMEE